MKALLLFFVFSCTLLSNAYAQMKAETENGKEILIYENGTWEYFASEDSVNISSEYDSYYKPKDSDSSISGNKVPYKIWYNDSKWKLTNRDVSDSADYTFRYKNEGAYCLVIAERVQAPVDALMRLAFENAKSVGKDFRIIKHEKRNVNGLIISMMHYEGKVKGIPFTYFGYFYTFEGGSIQFITYSGKSLFKEYKQELANLLNGLTIKGKQ